jgi:hypothetical protein
MRYNSGISSGQSCKSASVVATEFYAFYAGRLRVQLLDYLPRAVCAAIVYKDDFIRKSVVVHHALNPRAQFRQGFFFII